MSFNQPRIYAHRGASADFPEHTREAYVAAIEQGADGFECDIRLTKDSIPILWHDSTLERMAGVSGDIAALTIQEIRRHYPQVMLLDELLDLATAHKKDLAIETKHPVPTGREIESVLLAKLDDRRPEIAESGIEISVMSFSWFAIESVRRSMKEMNTVMLLNPRMAKITKRFTSAQTLGPSIELIRKKPQFISAAKKEGKRLFIWTVDAPEDVEFCALNGIDVVITNKPTQARKVLGYP
ncbi:MAG TPA: glycerophosphodiester phosphodiesterase family protein [Candidatus Nanopelagicaceae bacterium]